MVRACIRPLLVCADERATPSCPAAGSAFCSDRRLEELHDPNRFHVAHPGCVWNLLAQPARVPGVVLLDVTKYTYIYMPQYVDRSTTHRSSAGALLFLRLCSDNVRGVSSALHLITKRCCNNCERANEPTQPAAPRAPPAQCGQPSAAPRGPSARRLVFATARCGVTAELVLERAGWRLGSD